MKWKERRGRAADQFVLSPSIQSVQNQGLDSHCNDSAQAKHSVCLCVQKRETAPIYVTRRQNIVSVCGWVKFFYLIREKDSDLLRLLCSLNSYTVDLITELLFSQAACNTVYSVFRDVHIELIITHYLQRGKTGNQLKEEWQCVIFLRDLLTGYHTDKMLYKI